MKKPLRQVFVPSLLFYPALRKYSQQCGDSDELLNPKEIYGELLSKIHGVSKLMKGE